MSTLPATRRVLRGTVPVFTFLTVFILSGLRLVAQDDCSACAVFPSITVYHTLQSGPGNGIGFEAGKWKREAGSFSYFFGSSMVWNANPAPASKTGSGTKTEAVNMSMYVRGQVSLGNKLYVMLQPGIQDLSFFTLRAGFRYVIPVSNKVGIGLEPNYSIFQNQLAFNTNLHIALR